MVVQLNAITTEMAASAIRQRTGEIASVNLARPQLFLHEREQGFMGVVTEADAAHGKTEKIPC